MKNQARKPKFGAGVILFRRALATAILLVGFSGLISARAASEKDGFLTIGAVQFAVSEETYASAGSFYSALSDILDKVEAEAAMDNYKLDLVVFPEYTSAFLGLSVLSIEEINQIVTNPAISHGLIVEALIRTHGEMMDVWNKISYERHYAILAGSHLNVDVEGNIHNTAHIFDDGQITWTQEKVFAGGPEMMILKLKTGQVGDAMPIELDGFTIYTTICRDTFNKEWETALPKADLWIDIKANELPYTQEYYDQALTARLPGSPIDRGLTVSLSGEILGFRFTGPTEYLYDDGPIAGTDPYEENAVLIIRLPDRLPTE